MRTRGFVVAIILCVVASAGAFAQELTRASASDSCAGFTLRVLGEGLTKRANVQFTITIVPAKGSNITITGTAPVKPTEKGEFGGTFTRNWSDYKITLKDSYTLRGKARLATGTEKVVPINFALKTLSCKLTSNACLSTSSLAVLTQGTAVTAYVPNGAWSTLTTGLQVVPLEGGGTVASVPTTNVVNSCSSNSATGVTVCTANNTDVYLLKGSALTNTLTSGADAFASFSGGSCMNCGVAINNLTNTAVLAIGISTSPSQSGLQFLDLATNTFQTPVASNYIISEDVVWDQNRNLILSPGESGSYDIFQTSPSLVEYSNVVGGILDSGGEDCTTGIALAADEFTGSLYITDLTQAKFSVATWSGAGQFQSFSEFIPFAAGTSGIAVSPGSQLAVVAGEFGGNQFGVVQLPSASGAGIPAVVDYVAAALPNTPDGQVWQQGLDPHTVTAYVGPTSKIAYALLANGAGIPPTYLAIVDMQALMNAPRVAGSHNIDPTYDLLVTGVVKYIATF